MEGNILIERRRSSFASTNEPFMVLLRDAALLSAIMRSYASRPAQNQRSHVDAEAMPYALMELERPHHQSCRLTERVSIRAAIIPIQAQPQRWCGWLTVTVGRISLVSPRR